MVPNELGIPEPPQRVHWDNHFTQTILGLPGAYDLGPERCSWLIQGATDFMGDNGALTRFDDRHNADIVTGFGNQADFADTDLIVDPWAGWLALLRAFHGFANVCSPLVAAYDVLRADQRTISASQPCRNRFGNRFRVVKTERGKSLNQVWMR